jgi:hypothetical protein
MASPGEGGGVDQDTLASGKSAAQRRAVALLPQELTRILSASASGTTSVAELLEGLSHLGVGREQLLGVLRQLSGVLQLDERTGVVRTRNGGAGRQPLAPLAADPANAAAVNSGPAAMEVA